jgi:dihydrofolate reductase
VSLVVADMSMSVDGYVADPGDRVGPLFDWYGNGEVGFRFPGDGRQALVTEASAGHLAEMVAQLGALICGRRLYDHTGGWDGSHPAGVPVFVVTHHAPDSAPRGTTPIHFVTDGVASAVAQAARVAGDRTLVVASPSIAQQCLDAGLLDVIQVNLVPVLLGAGIPFFQELGRVPVMLDDPEVIQGRRVTHLRYRVRK